MGDKMDEKLKELDKWLEATLEPRLAVAASNAPAAPTPVPATPAAGRGDQQHRGQHDRNGGRGGHQLPPSNRNSQRLATEKKVKAPLRPTRGLLRCIPLGGLDEVGKNMMVFEYENDIVIVDMGFQFPEEDMLGVDYVIPDVSYLMDKLHKIRAILITHGHLDHIGAIPYLLPKLGFPPVYGSKLAMGLVKKRVEEFNIEKQSKLVTIDPDKTLRFGHFTIDWFRVNHSIPDSLGIVLRTPAGTCVHTGDFKFDQTPVFQAPADFAKIASFGMQNITALFSDSTNALKPGNTMSEKKIGETLDGIIKNARGRVIIASFSSLVGRIQHIINCAQKYGRKVYVSGRSMADTIAISQELQFIKAPPHLIIPINKIGNVKDEHALILTTGAQGEDVSALTRMSLGDHPHITIKRGDTIVLSSSPIPGNERSVYSVINNLVRLGANVIFNQVMDVHTSGHAQREDLKLMINLVKPRYLVPIHGELYMRQGHAEIGRELGMPEKQTVVVENGSVLEIMNGEMRVSKQTVPANYIMIDGKGVGDVGAQIIMERQVMAENGVLAVLYTVDAKTKKLIRDPEVITRGFIYMSESEEIVKEAVSVARKSYEEAVSRLKEWKRGEIKNMVRSALDRFTHRKIDRHPLILPIILEA
ncbi:ribonuclease J [Candidatus Gracilibacteria bacterium]|nr:ribonuclease J [Candidatus Gracilibacteria bacterium]